ncbi:MAG: ABC transporter ATP-binding protein [Deltaproteobacteria bacterium]|nr:ABC transporter ATP-binding protein [Deltaproteobacteria bacterium]
MAFIVAQNLQKSYLLNGKDLPVLKGVDLTIEKGECLFILGASGAGKSTLLHLIGLLDQPTGGSVLYNGEDLYSKKEAELALFRNRSIGFVFQFHYLLNDFSALENVMMPLLVRGENRSDAARAASKILEKLNLAHRKEHRPAELSGGEQQRVAVARALVTEPQIIFADEPTGNLDRETGESLLTTLLDDQKERNGSLVIVTHNEALMNKALAYPAGQAAERTKVRQIHLSDGRVA